jgi:hypothetical protein
MNIELFTFGEVESALNMRMAIIGDELFKRVQEILTNVIAE